MCDHKHLVDKVDRLILPDNIVPMAKLTLQSILLNQPKKSLSIQLTLKFNQRSCNFRILSIDFTGILNDKLKGFYRSKYVVNGEDRYIGTTQFEATDARRAFPCFDEPALKSFFNIKITISSHLTALSNMDTTSVIENNDDNKTFIFEQTPKMSTYIVAFVVGEFNHIESHTKEGIRVRVFKCIGSKESSEFALDVATKSLSYFIDYFGIPYPLNKCDHIAIPITIINRSGSQQQLDSEFFSQQPLVNEQ
ncbi:hypothetical protein ACTFIW_009626 [Dictyostelium discoideum]